MNEFYDIGDEGKEPEQPMQLKHLGARITTITIGRRKNNYWDHLPKASKDYSRATEAKDYDNAFARKILKTYPPYHIERLLDHHYTLYIRNFPNGHDTFIKHIRYVVLPMIKADKYFVQVELINEWIGSKREVIAASPNTMTVNQKLNKVLEFMVANSTRIDITASTIQKEIFKEAITAKEGQELFRHLLVSGKVRVIGYQFIAESIHTRRYLNEGGFGGENQISATQIAKPDMTEQKNGYPAIRAFISYAWGDQVHENKVLSLTEHLRKNIGVHAEIDKILSQEETAINFKNMMVMAMQYEKVIVVLSRNYKIKADHFLGGVGTEFSLLINDIDDNRNKYILVSFEGLSPEIIPFALKGRDIVDLSAQDGEETLVRKLTNQHKYVLSEVATKVPKLDPVKIDEYKAEMATADKMLHFLTKPREWSKDPGNVRHAYYKPQPEYKIEFTELGKFNMKESFCYYYLDPNSRIGDALFYYHGTILFQCKYMACDGMRIYLPVPEIAGISDDNYKEWYYYYNLSDLSGKLLGWFTDQSYSFSSGRASEPPFLIFKDKNEQKAFNSHAKRHLATIMQIEVGFLGSQAASEKNKANDQSRLNPAFLDQISQFHEREWAKLHKF